MKLRCSAEAFESAGRFQEELMRSRVAKTGREGGEEGGQRLNERVQVLGVFFFPPMLPLLNEDTKEYLRVNEWLFFLLKVKHPLSVQ